MLRSFGVDTKQDMSCAHATVMEGVHAAPTLDTLLQKDPVLLKFLKIHVQFNSVASFNDEVSEPLEY